MAGDSKSPHSAGLSLLAGAMAAPDAAPPKITSRNSIRNAFGISMSSIWADRE
jgi:hypothetical protein